MCAQVVRILLRRGACVPACGCVGVCSDWTVLQMNCTAIVGC